MNMWIAAIGAIALVAVGYAIRSRKRKQSLSALNAREALSDDEIYQRFYAASDLNKAAVLDVWHEIAGVLRAPAERLQPADRFGKDIGVFWITSEELDTLESVAQERAKRQGLTVDLASIETVDDYVKCFAPQNKHNTSV